MSSLTEIMDKKLGALPGADDMPVAARELIEGFEELKERSEGTFDFKAEKNDVTGSVYIIMTFKGPSDESRTEMEITANSSVSMEGRYYNREYNYSKNGNTVVAPTQKQVVDAAFGDVVDRVKECIEAIVPDCPEPERARVIAPVPAIRRGSLVTPRQ